MYVGNPFSNPKTEANLLNITNVYLLKLLTP